MNNKTKKLTGKNSVYKVNLPKTKKPRTKWLSNDALFS